MSIKIEPWLQPYDQRIYNGDGAWVIGNLIMQAEHLPIQEMPLEHLNILDLTLSGSTMRDIVMHTKAILDADLNYPIILGEDGDVLDGRHRIAKALLEEKDTIKFVRFVKNPTPDYYVTE